MGLELVAQTEVTSRNVPKALFMKNKNMCRARFAKQAAEGR